MRQIDFITAFGRLLRDASLREDYAREPLKVIERLGVASSDRAAVLSLNPDDLEFQAEVLLRKRFELVTRILPETCARAGTRAWPWFNEFARYSWPDTNETAVADALQFCAHLASKNDSVPADRERNQVRFATGSAWVAVHLVRGFPLGGHRRSCLQILVRSHHGRSHEFLVFPSP